MREERFGNITLVNGDCMEYMRQFDCALGSGCWLADLAVCDPDYDLGRRLVGGNHMARYGKSGCHLGGKPTAEYFDELRRVSKNQVIWGGNYFDFLPPTRCFLIWHKKDGPKNFSDCEYAWTSFDSNARLFSSARNPKGISGNDKRIVICQKPVQLYMWIYENYAKEGDRILDTHMGSASSAIAAYECGLEYVGIEINEEYFDKAVARLKKHIETHSKALL